MSTYRINPDKKTVPTTTIAKAYPKIALFETLINVYTSSGVPLGDLESKRNYGNKYTNSFFETMGEYTNTSIRYGVYAPYLQKNDDNKVVDGIDSDNFYTESILDINDELSIFQKSKNISKQNSFTFYNNLQNREEDSKQYIKFITERPIEEISLEEFNMLQEQWEASQAEESFDVQWEPDIKEPSLWRYAAPDADGCGYCAKYEWRWAGGTSWDCNVPAPEGFVFYSGDGINNCGINASGLLSTCGQDFSEIPQNVFDTLGIDASTYEGYGLITTYRIKSGETFDTEDECNKYKENPSTSGCYDWIPPSGVSMYPVTGIPEGYAYCSDIFFIA